MKILLDTCTIIWAISEPDKLSLKTQNFLLSEDAEISVSAISCAEIACAADRGRIKLNRHWKKWFNYYVDLNQWNCLDISLKIIEEAFSLPGSFHPDPAVLVPMLQPVFGCFFNTP